MRSMRRIMKWGLGPETVGQVFINVGIVSLPVVF